MMTSRLKRWTITLTVLAAALAGSAVLYRPLLSYGGLETPCTYISDLVATNPLSSDLASTSDDHLRCIKTAVKGSFPNVNAAVTATDEQLNSTTTNVAANPTGTVGLTAVNGSAVTYLRSDGAPALSQAISPTWSGQHTFTNPILAGSGSASLPGIAFSADTDTGIYRITTNDMGFATGGTQRANFNASGVFAIYTPETAGPSTASIFLDSNVPSIGFREEDGAANNKDWDFIVNVERFSLRACTDAGSCTNVFDIDRTSNTIDTINLQATSIQTNGFNATNVTGTYTCNVSGLTSDPAPTCRYVRSGDIVTLFIPTISGTSNTTTFSLSGAIPSSHRPSRVQQFIIPNATDNGAATGTGDNSCDINTDGTVTFRRTSNANGWTGSNTKGVTNFSVTYLMT